MSLFCVSSTRLLPCSENDLPKRGTWRTAHLFFCLNLSVWCAFLGIIGASDCLDKLTFQSMVWCVYVDLEECCIGQTRSPNKKYREDRLVKTFQDLRAGMTPLTSVSFFLQKSCYVSQAHGVLLLFRFGKGHSKPTLWMFQDLFTSSYALRRQSAEILDIMNVCTALKLFVFVLQETGLPSQPC